jgi:hypothetical protein
LYSDRWSQRLRQGDIVGQIPYPKFKGVPQWSRRSGWAEDAPANEILEYPASRRFAVIVSHDCEFNETKRAHFLVARVQDFAPTLSDDTRAQIRAANDAIREAEDGSGERFDYIDSFVLDPLEDCFAETQVVSFTTITALPMSMRRDVEAVKQAELAHEHRVRLRRKLAFFFGREGEDVPDAEKRDRPLSGEAGSAGEVPAG